MLRATCYCVPQNQAVNAHDRADGGEDDVDGVEDDVDKGEDQADDEEGLRGQSYTWLYFGCILVTSGCISIVLWLQLVLFMLYFCCSLFYVVEFWVVSIADSAQTEYCTTFTLSVRVSVRVSQA